MRHFLITGGLLVVIAGCTPPEAPPEDTGPEIVPLSITLPTE